MTARYGREDELENEESVCCVDSLFGEWRLPWKEVSGVFWVLCSVNCVAGLDRLDPLVFFFIAGLETRCDWLSSLAAQH